jgi:hypothetical protein
LLGRRSVSNSSRSDSSPASAPARSTGIGADVTLTVSSGLIPVAPRENDYDRLVQLLRADDTRGIYELATTGRVFFVEPGTRAKVIGRKFEAREVRIQSGQFSGRSGWVLSSLVE